MNTLDPDTISTHEVNPNFPKDNSKQRVQLLSVDGGGVRCIIPLRILKEITKRTGLAVHELFDGFAGTSAGAFLLNTLLLPGDNKGAKFTPEELWKRLDTDLPIIFNETFCEEVEGGFGLFKSKYSPAPLKKSVFDLVDEALFKDQIGEILVPSFDMRTYEPIFFTRQEARNDKNKSAMKVYDVILATTAAPTYFPPHEMNINGITCSCVDGGVVANNPSAFCYAQTKKLGYKKRNILLVSIGAGLPNYSLEFNKATSSGLIRWLPNIENVFFSGSEKASNVLTKNLLQNHYRINVPIKASHDGLDDASKKNLHYLKKVSKKWIKQNNEYLDDLCKKLIIGRETKKG